MRSLTCSHYAGVALLLMLSIAARADTSITVSGTVINPASCVINDNQMISVNFGDDLVTTRLTDSAYGDSYMKTVVYTLRCVNASKVKMVIKGHPAPFNARLLKTEQASLGVALRVGSTLLEVNNTEYEFTYPDSPQLVAVPVRQAGASLMGGRFNAGATMVLIFP
ncbi:fimbrial protein [Serratia marcescens]|uniref:fimbrial protein n=1 Tax=Serratia marcescens TaxID=615 RepID=UPI0011522694|nr:fimbrial protein [Serratia marcescens]QDI20298.1 fimbrial protein [Serratia marcescens]QDI30042.1 fimbrial protein [Serratia marcescens]QDI44546.1 fimbrial protein [Serratia marcescens]QDI58971.1 fimbrial protein [Serratia marcescens]QLJ67563.1 fimbrial protein [Serratia marcescens]